MIKLTLEDINSLKSIGTSRSAGNYGKIKKYNDDKVIKIFKDDEFIERYHIENQMRRLINIDVDNVALPTDLVYVDGKFKGYIMPYFRGLSLSIILKKIEKGVIAVSEEEINILYGKLIDKVKELSKKHIKISDIKPDNIIYYNNELCLVDCDFYRLSDMSDLEKYNISLVDGAIKTHLSDLFNYQRFCDNNTLEYNNTKNN